MAEIRRYRHNIIFIIFVVCVFYIAIQDAVIARHPFLGKIYLEQGFLLAESNQGHGAAITLFWLLPVYYFAISGEGLLRERAQNIVPIELTRMTKQRYLRGKILIAPALVSGTYLLAIIVNALVLSLIASPRPAPPDSGMLEVFSGMKNMHFWIYDHRLLTYGLYTLMMVLIVFSLGVLVNAVIIAVPDRKIAYPTLLMYWLLWWLGKFSLSTSLQPFTEYGLSYGLTSLLAFLIISVIISWLLWRRLMIHDWL